MADQPITAARPVPSSVPIFVQWSGLISTTSTTSWPSARSALVSAYLNAAASWLHLEPLSRLIHISSPSLPPERPLSTIHVLAHLLLHLLRHLRPYITGPPDSAPLPSPTPRDPAVAIGCGRILHYCGLALPISIVPSHLATVPIPRVQTLHLPHGISVCRAQMPVGVNPLHAEFVIPAI